MDFSRAVRIGRGPPCPAPGTAKANGDRVPRRPWGRAERAAARTRLSKLAASAGLTGSAHRRGPGRRFSVGARSLRDATSFTSCRASLATRVGPMKGNDLGATAPILTTAGAISGKCAGTTGNGSFPAAGGSGCSSEASSSNMLTASRRAFSDSCGGAANVGSIGSRGDSSGVTPAFASGLELVPAAGSTGSSVMDIAAVDSTEESGATFPSGSTADGSCVIPEDDAILGRARRLSLASSGTRSNGGGSTRRNLDGGSGRL